MSKHEKNFSTAVKLSAKKSVQTIRKAAKAMKIRERNATWSDRMYIRFQREATFLKIEHYNLVNQARELRANMTAEEAKAYDARIDARAKHYLSLSDKAKQELINKGYNIQ